MTAAVDPAHDNHSDDLDVVPPLGVRWRVKFPAVQILASGRRVFLIGYAEIRAVDVRTGRTLWRRPWGGMAAAYDRGRLFVAPGRLVALDAATGRTIWKQPQRDEAFGGTPVATGGVVYLTDANGPLEALAESDGHELWQVNDVGGTGAPAVGGGRVLFAGDCANAAGFRAADGAQLWRRSTGCGGSGIIVPALHAGRLWVPESDYNHGDPAPPPILDAGTGALRSRYLGGQPAFLDGLAVFSVPGLTVARDEHSGRVVWRRPLAGSVLAIGHDVFEAAADQVYRATLVVLDGEHGRPLWATPGMIGSPTGYASATGVAPGTVLISAGAYTWAYSSLLHPAPGGVAIFDGPVFLLSGDSWNVVGNVGHRLRGRDLPVEFQAARLHGQWGTARRVTSSRDGSFNLQFTLFGDVRVRARVSSGASSGIVTFYVFPRVSLGQPSLTRSNQIRLPVTVRSPRFPLDGHTFALYLHRWRSRRVTLIATGRLRGHRGARATTVLQFAPLRHVSSRDELAFCVVGALRLGLGYPDAFDRGCGAQSLPF